MTRGKVSNSYGGYNNPNESQIINQTIESNFEKTFILEKPLKKSTAKGKSK